LACLSHLRRVDTFEPDPRLPDIERVTINYMSKSGDYGWLAGLGSCQRNGHRRQKDCGKKRTSCQTGAPKFVE
jgi:hypothetical protein